MGMKRRDVLKSVLLGSGAALAPHGHTQMVTGIAPASAAAAKAAEDKTWKPLLFDEHQNETVVALSELIIPATDTPGAKAAKVNRYIDLILNDGDPDDRNAFLLGLGWLDGYALRRHNAPFVECSEKQQVAMLESLQAPQNEELKPGWEFFKLAKRLTVEGYYTSKTGIDELNKGGRVPSTFACQHEEHA